MIQINDDFFCEGSCEGLPLIKLQHILHNYLSVLELSDFSVHIVMLVLGKLGP